MKELENVRLLTLVYPIVTATEPSREKCLALFEYAIHEDEQNEEINVFTLDSTQILPSQEEMEASGLSFVNHLRIDDKGFYSDSIYFRNEDPVFIRNKEDLAVLQNSLVDRIFRLLQYSLPDQQ